MKRLLHKNNVMRRAVMLGLLSAVASSAQATFYVQDTATPEISAIGNFEPPSPTPPLPAVRNIEIPFAANRSVLGPMGRNALRSVLNMCQAAGRIVIETYNSHGKGRRLPFERADHIRRELVAKGVDPALISVRPSQEHERHVRNIYYTSVYVYGDSARTAPAVVTPQIASNVPDLTPVPSKLTAANPIGQGYQTSAPSEIMDVTRRIVTLTENKRISADAALVVLSEFVQPGQANPYGAAQLPTPVRPPMLPANATLPPVPGLQPTVARVTQPLLTITPAPATPLVWVINPSKTLKDNIADWAQKAGYKPLVWQSANFYQVSNAATFQGDFVSVMRQIAQLTNLDIQIWPNDKIIKISDSGNGK